MPTLLFFSLGEKNWQSDVTHCEIALTLVTDRWIIATLPRIKHLRLRVPELLVIAYRSF